MQRRTVLLVRSDDCGWADLRLLLRSMSDVRVVGETVDARRALELATALTPDVVMAATSLDGSSTAPLLVELRSRASPASKILVTAARLDPGILSDLLDIGVSGYLLWGDLSTATLGHLLAAIFPSDIVVASREVAEAFVATQCGRRGRHGGSIPLSERERTVLRWLAEGLSAKQIAQVEPLSQRTVERIVGHLEAKLDAPTQFVLALKAVRLGLLR